MIKRLMIIGLLLWFSYVQLSFYTSASQTHLAIRPQKTVDIVRFDNGVLKTKTIQYANGDKYWMKSVEFSNSKQVPYTIDIPLKGKNGTFRFVEKRGQAKVWRHLPLAQALPKATGFLETNGQHILISSPDIYTKQPYGTLEEKENPLPTKILQTAQGYVIRVQFPQKRSTTVEIWALESKQPLVEWKSNPNLAKIWLTLDLHLDQKWSWDGFYVRTPHSYRPYSPNMFWRLPTNYALNSFLITGGSRAAEDLGWMMLDTILPNQNADGYWETQPRSEWLWKEYGITAGFYDTRFNTDIATLLLKGYQKYRHEEFYRSAQIYSGWLLKHIEQNHYVVHGKEEGWLAADYSGKTPHIMTHVSLNHQLQEMNFLYHMYLQSRLDTYKQYADKLLHGVKNTKKKWIKPNHDLHYAYLNNGQMGLPDYPYLTYNDLVESQILLKKINGAPDPDLAELMASKKRWMDQHKIHGYRKVTF